MASNFPYSWVVVVLASALAGGCHYQSCHLTDCSPVLPYAYRSQDGVFETTYSSPYAIVPMNRVTNAARNAVQASARDTEGDKDAPKYDVPGVKALGSAALTACIQSVVPDATKAAPATKTSAAEEQERSQEVLPAAQAEGNQIEEQSSNQDEDEAKSASDGKASASPEQENGPEPSVLPVHDPENNALSECNSEPQEQGTSASISMGITRAIDAPKPAMRFPVLAMLSALAAAVSFGIVLFLLVKHRRDSWRQTSRSAG